MTSLIPPRLLSSAANNSPLKQVLSRTRSTASTVARVHTNTNLRPRPRQPIQQRRSYHPTHRLNTPDDAAKAPKPLTSPAPSISRPGLAIPRPAQPSRVETQPHYQLTFTCVPCSHRSDHKISKQGYHHGSVLITCPGCRARHVMSDHLGIFGDKKITVEDLMRERGRLVKRGTLGEDGDIEFWDDETPAGGQDAAQGQQGERDGQKRPEQ